MSDETESLEAGSNEENGPKALREALAKANKKNAEFEAKLAEFEEAKLKVDIAAALKEAGVNEGLAKFYTSKDASAEAVKAWVTENATLFGLQQEAPVDEAKADAAAKVQAVLGQALPVAGKTLEDQQQRWANATDEELFKDIIFG